MVRVGTGTCRDSGRGHPSDRCVVVVRNGNYSAFGGYRFQPSDYSEVRCLDCLGRWRSNGRYVDDLSDGTITSGHPERR